jgi:hypothetical protein
MDAQEVPFEGVVRLEVGDELVGEFVPGSLWPTFYAFAQATYREVRATWRPFRQGPTPQERMTEALHEMENHIPKSASPDWITCSCGDAVRPFYWVRHTQGADGSALARTVLQQLKEEEDAVAWERETQTLTQAQ